MADVQSIKKVDAPMRTCREDSEDVQAASSSMVSWDETSELCEVMRGALSQYPTVGELRYLGLAVELLRAKGYDVPRRQSAIQILGIANDLGRLDSEARMKSAFDDTFKVYEGTGGIVTPADLLQNLGKMSQAQASALSDDGLFTIAATIKESKLRGQ